MRSLVSAAQSAAEELAGPRSPAEPSTAGRAGGEGGRAGTASTTRSGPTGTSGTNRCGGLDGFGAVDRAPDLAAAGRIGRAGCWLAHPPRVRVPKLPHRRRHRLTLRNTNLGSRRRSRGVDPFRAFRTLGQQHPDRPWQGPFHLLPPSVNFQCHPRPAGEARRCHRICRNHRLRHGASPSLRSPHQWGSLRPDGLVWREQIEPVTVLPLDRRCKRTAVARSLPSVGPPRRRQAWPGCSCWAWPGGSSWMVQCSTSKWSARHSPSASSTTPVCPSRITSSLTTT